MDNLQRKCARRADSAVVKTDRCIEELSKPEKKKEKRKKNTPTLEKIRCDPGGAAACQRNAPLIRRVALYSGACFDGSFLNARPLA